MVELGCEVGKTTSSEKIKRLGTPKASYQLRKLSTIIERICKEIDKQS